jgi:NDP-hexose-3-ketoreductase
MFIFQDVPKSIFCNLNIDKKLGIDISGNILLTFKNNKTGFLSFGYENYFQSTYSMWGNKGFIKCERAFNVTNNMRPRLSVYKNDKMKQFIIPEADQFKLTIENFSFAIQKKSLAINLEKEFLNQALVMDAARKSNMKNSVIKIKN